VGLATDEPTMEAVRSVTWPDLKPALPASCQNCSFMNTRFLWAMGTYAVLALLAALTLEGLMRDAVWILLGGLAVKTYIAKKAGW
jgi:hypothetical protein